MAKKKYEKPQLKGEKLFEAGAKTCCKLTTAACSVSGRTAGGKTNQAQNTS